MNLKKTTLFLRNQTRRNLIASPARYFMMLQSATMRHTSMMKPTAALTYNQKFMFSTEKKEDTSASDCIKEMKAEEDWNAIIDSKTPVVF